LGAFAGYFASNLAREVARLTGWTDKIWARRYQAIVISNEEKAQAERLEHILSRGVKEDLVEKITDWPGLHCVHSLLSGQPTEGTWFNRTQAYEARNRGESIGLLAPLLAGSLSGGLLTVAGTLSARSVS
jgi:hypothetical protein